MAARARRSRIASLPAPIGGLNARDSVSLMPATDALALDNWFPNATSVDIRKGYERYATFTGQCETIFAYNGTATRIFAAIVNGTTRGIYQITSGGIVTSIGAWGASWGASWGSSWGSGTDLAASVGGSGNTVQAITNSRYDYVNFGTTGGQFLSVVNGADTPLQYNGSAWSASTITGSGLTPSVLFTVAVYAERLFFGGSGFDVWYLPVSSITGTATRLNLASLFKLGGRLSNIVTWSADTSSELADFIAFVSTEGEVVAFAGTDPASQYEWARVSHFRIGKPVCRGNRAWTKLGSEAVLATVDGVVPLSLAVRQSRADVSGAVSDKIRTLFNRDAQVYGNSYGWSVVLHPAGQKLIVNVPTSELETAYQYVMNTQTGAWCRYTGWNAICFETTRDRLYFGGDGYVARADYGNTDNGESVTSVCKQAFSYLDDRGALKSVTMIRPVLTSDGGYSVGIQIDTDYQDRGLLPVQSVSGSTGDPWGGIWDAVWSGAVAVQRTWRSSRGLGFAIAPKLRVVADDVSVSWSSTDFVYEVARGI